MSDQRNKYYGLTVSRNVADVFEAEAARLGITPLQLASEGLEHYAQVLENKRKTEAIGRRARRTAASNELAMAQQLHIQIGVTAALVVFALMGLGLGRFE